MKQEPKELVGVYLTRSVRKHARRLAFNSGVKFSYLVEDAIKKYIYKEKKTNV